MLMTDSTIWYDYLIDCVFLTADIKIRLTETICKAGQDINAWLFVTLVKTFLFAGNRYQLELA